MADEQPQVPPQKQLLMQKIYVKDLSFESPRTPAVFSANTTPQTQLSLKSNARPVGQNLQEVTLTITVETKDQEQTLFLVELAQAGLFQLEGYTPEETDMLLGAYCPSTLYPYAREAISDLITRGGFPQLLLQPINFDALYAQAQQQRAQQQPGAAPVVETSGTVNPPAGTGETH
jgi:preprotein translocase subunit SecB